MGNVLPRMLVTRIGALGDVCMMIPVVRELERYFEVDWLIRDCYESAVQSFPQLRCRTIGVSPAPGDVLASDDPLIDRLRARNYEYCLDFSHWPVVSDLVSHLSSIPVRAITRDPKQDALLAVNPLGLNLEQSFNCVVDVDPKMHQVDKWRTLIRGSCGLEIGLNWPLPPQRGPGNALRIFVHPHAGKSNKIWPPGRFAEVLSTLARRRPVHCVIHKARGSLARSVQWRLLLSRCTSEVVPIDPSLNRLRQQLQLADLAIGCDSGPMHFASLLGTATLVVYGPYSPNEFSPLWRTADVIPKQFGDPASAIPASRVQARLEALVTQLESSEEVRGYPKRP
jgi:ADP-heptose:LPS heptosyltransferase